MDKKIIIIGATSGIGREVALIYIAKGWKVGIAGRREAELEAIRAMAPQQVSAQALDVTLPDATDKLHALIEQVGGMDVFLLSSGIGKQNYALQTDIELKTAATNVEGFIRMTNAAYHYFELKGHGHLAVISSIAGTKGLGAPLHRRDGLSPRRQYQRPRQEVVRLQPHGDAHHRTIAKITRIVKLAHLFHPRGCSHKHNYRPFFSICTLSSSSTSIWCCFFCPHKTCKIYP